MTATIKHKVKMDLTYQNLIDRELSRIGVEIGEVLRPRFDLAATDELEAIDKILSSIREYMHLMCIKNIELLDSGEGLDPCLGCGDKFCRDDNCK